MDFKLLAIALMLALCGSMITALDSKSDEESTGVISHEGSEEGSGAMASQEESGDESSGVTSSEDSDEESSGEGPGSESGEEATSSTDDGTTGFLDPKDFVRGSLIRVTDVSAGGVDPIPNSGKFEGDIDLRGLPYEAYVDKVIDDSPFKTEKEIGSSAIRDKWFLWPNAEIPYEIGTSKFSRYDKGVIASAAADYEKYTCIRWIPRQAHHRDYVRFMVGGGCYSSVGKAGGRQDLSLGRGCVTKGIIIHEMMHAVGFFHEQSRADRDEYITIKWDNLHKWARGNFQKMTLEQIDHLGTKYDYGSIMHYGKTYFTKNGAVTIVTKDPKANIGQRRGFSSTDIEDINKLYKCLESKKPITTPRPPTTVKFCADENDHCEWWSKNNQCVEAESYMMKYCKRSCKACRTETECHDKKKYCEHWKNEGYCTKDFVSYMKKYCKKSCDFC